MYPVIYFVLPALAKATFVITVYGDVHKDKDFFTRTYPWIVDNVGGDVTVDYHLLGSGRYSVPQMCALGQLRLNTFLQAEFLKCEAEGTMSEICLCKSGIDPRKFRQCVLERGYMAGTAALKYSQLKLDVTPVIELGPRNIVSQAPDEVYLKKICGIFGDDSPKGCNKPTNCDNGTDYIGSRAIAYFDCSKIDSCPTFNTQPIPTYTTPYTYDITTVLYTTNTPPRHYE